jgi:hypothetical protein
VHSFHLKLMGLIFITMLLTSCALTYLADTWHNPNMTFLRHHKLLLVYISKNETTCKVYEDYLAGELRRRGIESVAGHAIFPMGKRVNSQTIAKGVEESGADAVLTMKNIGALRQTSLPPDNADIYKNYWYPGSFLRWDLYGYMDGASYYESPYISIYEIAKIQVNLFDVQSGKLQSATTIQTAEPENVPSVSKELSTIVINSLINEGLI